MQPCWTSQTELFAAQRQSLRLAPQEERELVLLMAELLQAIVRTHRREASDEQDSR
jgi:hypothetical protein